MLLNNLSQNFAIWIPANFFYSEVVKLWKPVMKRKYLPYITLEDMFNAQITAISFPSINTSNFSQILLNYKITKRGGLQLDQTMNKQLTLTIKLGEGCMTYFMARQQFELFEKWGANYKNLYMPPINITLLDDGGFENVTYTYYLLTPNSLSDFDLSYAARVGQFLTFTWTFDYNYFDIWYRDDNGTRIKMDLDINNGQLQDEGSPYVKNNDGAITAKNNIKRLNIISGGRSMLDR